jgi:hypothetical protein
LDAAWWFEESLISYLGSIVHSWHRRWQSPEYRQER